MTQHMEPLYAGVSCSYATYIHGYLELINNPIFFSIPYFDQELFDIQESLKNIFLDLPNVLTAQTSDKENCANTLLSLKKLLEDKYCTLYAYKRELHHLTSLKQLAYAQTDDYFKAAELEPEDIENVDYKQLATDCSHFIFESQTEKEKQQHASHLLPYIPIRITKDNFLAYTQKSMLHIDFEDTPQSAAFLTRILSQIFDGHWCESYGTDFADVYQSLEALTQIEDYESFFEESDLLDETLDNLSDILQNFYHMIGSLSNLLLFDELDFNELTNLHASFFDFYYSLKRILTNDTEADFLKASLPERVEAVLKEEQENFKKIPKELKTHPLYRLMQSYLSLELSNLFGFSIASSKNYSSETGKILHSFLSKLKARLLDLPPFERKQRMQYFMGHLPFVMSEANFNLYIQEGLTHFKSPRSGYYTTLCLSHILETDGFFGKPASEEEAPIIEEIENAHDDSYFDLPDDFR